MSRGRGSAHEDHDNGVGSVAADTVPARYAIVVARYYSTLAERLANGALRVLATSGIDTEADVDLHEVPGAFEIPLAAALLARSGAYAGVVCLGAVIRGETSHYDIVCHETARGIGAVQLETLVPCGFGVLTCDDLEQAMARSGEGASRHAGEQAAAAVVALSSLRHRVRSVGEG